MNDIFSFPIDTLNRLTEEFKSDKAAQIISNGIRQSGLSPAFMNYDSKKQPFTFSIDLGFDDACDQGETGRCWAFSALNMLRWNAKNKLKLNDKHFELSQNYIYFYDQLDKAWKFLVRLAKTAAENPNNPRINRMVAFPIEDNGQPHRAILLCEQYGIVPKYAMPDTECSKNTRYVTKLLGMKLSYGANEIIKAALEGASSEKLDAIVNAAFEGVVKILLRFLGEPPKTFTLEYTDESGNYHRIPDVDPVSFYNEYCKNGEYVTLIHHPSKKLKFNQAYVYDFFDEGERKGPQTLLNLPMDDFKRVVINQLKNGNPAALGADVREQNSRDMGWMDPSLYDYEAIFDTELNMSKEDRIRLKKVKGTHIMTFTGVNIGPDGKSDRWKVQNSYGPQTGINGFYLMTDEWFTEYVVSTMVNRDAIPADLAYLLEQEPVPVSKDEFY